MNCSMAQETELHFLSSDIRIVPQSVEYQSDKTNYDYARVDISRQAGDHLDEYAKIPEPVEIHTGGRKLCDLYFGENSLTLDKEKAALDLLDGRKVLERAVIDKKFHSVTLGNVFQWFKNKVKEAKTGSVIRDVRLVGDVDRSRETEDLVQEAIDVTSPNGESDGSIDADNVDGMTESYLEFKAWVGRSISGLAPSKDKEEGGLDFNQANLSQVLMLIEREFGLSSYMDSNRVLNIGYPEVEPSLYYAGEGPEMFRVSEYNLTKNPSSIKMVSVKGGFTQVKSPSSDPTTDSWDYKLSKKMQWWAFASTEWPDFNSITDGQARRMYVPDKNRVDGRVVSVSHKSSSNKTTLKKLAVRRLMDELVNKVSGSIDINPLKSSTVHGFPQDVMVGDSIGVFPGEQDMTCVDTLEKDLFTITGITHSIDGKRGWEMNLELARTPLQDIYAAAMPWPKVPDSGSGYEDYEKYYKKAMDYDHASYFWNLDGDGEKYYTKEK